MQGVGRKKNFEWIGLSFPSCGKQVGRKYFLSKDEKLKSVKKEKKRNSSNNNKDFGPECKTSRRSIIKLPGHQNFARPRRKYQNEPILYFKIQIFY